jgi:hypothetical protein
LADSELATVSPLAQHIRHKQQQAGEPACQYLHDVSDELTYWWTNYLAKATGCDLLPGDLWLHHCADFAKVKQLSDHGFFVVELPEKGMVAFGPLSELAKQALEQFQQRMEQTALSLHARLQRPLSPAGMARLQAFSSVLVDRLMALQSSLPQLSVAAVVQAAQAVLADESVEQYTLHVEVEPQFQLLLHFEVEQTPIVLTLCEPAPSTH